MLGGFFQLEWSSCSENIFVGQYLTLVSQRKIDVISLVEEKHEIMLDKGFFK